MILHYDRDRSAGNIDVYVVGPKKLAEHKGERIAVHDGKRDIFVLLPEDLSRKVVTEALKQRQLQDIAAAEAASRAAILAELLQSSD